MNRESQLEISQRLISSLYLSDSDRQSLKTKRGFSDEVIDKFKFKSCSQSLLQTTEMAWLKDKDIYDCLVNENILIPYFNVDNEIFHVRPHKFGITNWDSQVYIPYPFEKDLFEKPHTLVIAEGEFKAIASCVMGIASIAVPGVSSFSKEKFPILADVLRKIQPKKIVICFDKEDKSDPKSPKFKHSFEKKYITEYYAILMAKLIYMEHIADEVVIADFKKEWMQDYKADIDGYLASGRKHSEYRTCIRDAKPPFEYQLNLGLKKIHYSFLNRMIDKYFYSGPVRKIYNSYWFQVGDKKIKKTNFKIRITNSMQTKDEIVRMCQFISDYGESVPFQLKAEQMTTKINFIKKCYSLGDFEFYGDDNDLRLIWSYVFQHQTGREVFEMEYYGYVKDIDCWLFEGGAYNNSSGEFIPADEDGVLWIDDIGYRLPEAINTGLKQAKIPLPVEENKINFKELLSYFSMALQSEIDDDATNQGMFARVILGWTFSCLFMPELINDQARDGFPFMFLYGRAASGKTTLAGWINAFFGMGMAKGLQLGGTTKVGLQLACGMYSMLPVWLDEYRSDDKVGDKNSFFRSVYDRSTSLKGSKIQGRARQYPSRSTLLVSGEEFPNDHALNTRCIIVPLFHKRTKIGEAFKWIEMNKERFTDYSSYILSNKKTLWQKFSTEIESVLKMFTNEGFMNRVTKNFAFPMAMSNVMFGNDENFDVFMKGFIKSFEASRSNEQSLNVFFSDLADMLVTGFVDCSFACYEKHGNKQTLFINLKAAYMLWENQAKRFRVDLPMKFDVIQKWIDSSDFILERKIRKIINGTRVATMSIDVSHKDTPIQIKDFANIVSQKQRKQTMAEMQENLTIEDMED